MSISLTPAAADRVRSFLVSRGQGIGLRLGVRKTGCSSPTRESLTITGK